jgi:hypothetical protein
MAPFMMGFSKGDLSGGGVIPDGWYYLQFTGFKPAYSKDKGSVHFKPEFEVVQHAELNGRRVWPSVNSKAGWIVTDFSHAFGQELVEIDNENKGTDQANLTIPGVFEGYDENPGNPDVWKYHGPFTNGVIYAEVATEIQQNGKPRNEIRQYKCAILGCEVRHSTNLLRKK